MSGVHFFFPSGHDVRKNDHLYQYQKIEEGSWQGSDIPENYQTGIAR